MNTYDQFLEAKRHVGARHGFKPTFAPAELFDFQRSLLEWSVELGRAAIFADCGLGKTPIQLSWAENVVRHENKPVLVLTPLAVASQTIREGEKFGIECVRSNDGKPPAGSRVVVTNYQKLHLFSADDYAGIVCDESSILKNFDGATKAAITDFARKIKYRLLCTATAAPNDYIELGTSSEALGELGFMDMLNRFFKKAATTSSRSDEFRAGCIAFADTPSGSNPGENVFTPFMGVGSEVYGAVLNGRRGIGAELKRSYYLQAVKNCESIEREKETAGLAGIEA